MLAALDFSLKVDKGMLWSLVSVFGGCMGSMVVVEKLVGIDKGVGSLLTVTEVLFVLISFLPKFLVPKGGSGGFVVDWLSHSVHAGMWLTMTILTNLVFSFGVSVPVHMLFRSCNILSSALIGRLFFKSALIGKQQLIGIVCTSVGIFITTLADNPALCCSWDLLNQAISTGGEVANGKGMGIVLLVVVLLLQGTLGHVQRVWIFDKYGKAVSDELMFVSHLAALVPLLGVMREDIFNRLDLVRASPMGLVLLLLNNLSQLVCISGVFRLAAEVSPLTVNMILAVRKFASVLFSVWYFGNMWSGLHSVGTLLVFTGVLLYSI